MYKTSVHLQSSFTRDEALALILGLGDQRIVLTEYDPDIHDEIDIESEFSFCLEEHLNDEFELLEGEYKLAKYNGEPADIIAKKLEKFNKLKQLISKAEEYTRQFDDEISKGESSDIRLDKSGNSFTPRYTLISIYQWSINSLKFPAISLDSFLNENTKLAELLPASIKTITDTNQNQIKKLNMREQEEAILAKIKELGHDPKSLARNDPGKAGVKFQIRNSLGNNRLFQGSTIFDKAWERLSKFKLIVYKE